jgi:hypothetical protein
VVTPGFAGQVAALPAIHPTRQHAAIPNINAQAGPSRNQVLIQYFNIHIY